MKYQHRSIGLVAMLLLSVLLAACGQISPTSDQQTSGRGPAVTLNYGLWDTSQLGAYQACADAFTQQHPDIGIKIEQLGWDDYWSGIQFGFISNTAYDVFTNHLSKYPEYVQKKQLVDIQPLVERDQVDTSIYIEGLPDLWTRDGKRYGLPKDWDTVAAIYNQDMFAQAGVDPAVMQDWSWNPQDGGEFEKIVAQLTIDANGNNGLSPNFDRNNVKQYGFVMPGSGSGGAYGQTEWSHFAVSNGFRFTDGLWGTQYHYDDPKLAETLQWLADLSLKKGYSPKFADIKSLGGNAFFASGRAAMLFDGSWMINWYRDNTSFPIGFGKLPVGPEGRKTMFNGLADSIWIGTKHKEESWQWVKFLGSAECQNIVGTKAVVFPAIQSGVDNALRAFGEKGLDVKPFTDEALDPNGTFLFPVTDNASQVGSIMTPSTDSILLGQAQAADILKQANTQVNAVFKKSQP